MSSPPGPRHPLLRLAGCLGAALALAALSTVASRILNPYLVQILVFAGCNIILAVGLHLINGVAGQFSLGHAGFMSIGAYLAAGISVAWGQAWLARFAGTAAQTLLTGGYMLGLMVVGGLGAAVVGLLVGLPSLRLRGDYLAIATLGFGEIIRVVLLNVEAVGGARGLSGIPRYTSLFLVCGAAVLCLLAVRNLLQSVHGRALLAVREDETAAEALGIDCARYKTAAFVIGAFMAGVAGCLFAHYLQFIHPRGFDFMKSVELVLMVVLGRGTLGGVVVAAVALTLVPEGLRQVKDLLHLTTDPRMVIYAALLIAVMLIRPRRRPRPAACDRAEEAANA